jgi:hypothetical protein
MKPLSFLRLRNGFVAMTPIRLLFLTVLLGTAACWAAKPACPDGTYKCWNVDHYECCHECCPIFDPSVKVKIAPAFTNCQFVHAEMAAITDAVRSGVSTQGCILYTTTFPCHDCVKVAAPTPKDLPEPCPGPKPPICPVPLPIGPVVCKCEGSNGKPDTFVLIFNPARYRL